MKKTGKKTNKQTNKRTNKNEQTKTNKQKQIENKGNKVNCLKPGKLLVTSSGLFEKLNLVFQTNYTERQSKTDAAPVSTHAVEKTKPF